MLSRCLPGYWALSTGPPSVLWSLKFLLLYDLDSHIASNQLELGFWQVSNFSFEMCWNPALLRFRVVWARKGWIRAGHYRWGGTRIPGMDTRVGALGHITPIARSMRPIVHCLPIIMPIILVVIILIRLVMLVFLAITVQNSPQEFRREKKAAFSYSLENRSRLGGISERFPVIHVVIILVHFFSDSFFSRCYSPLLAWSQQNKLSWFIW